MRIGLASGCAILLTLAAGCAQHAAPPGETTATGPPSANISKDPWKLATNSPFGSHGGYLGNGFLGMRFGASGTTDSPSESAGGRPAGDDVGDGAGSPDSQAPSFTPMGAPRPLLCIVAGLYAGENLVAAPDWGRLGFEANGAVVGPGSGGVSEYRQALDLRHGELVTSYRVTSGRPAFSVEMTTLIHRDEPNLVTFAARVTPEGDGEITVAFPPPATDRAFFAPAAGSAPGASPGAVAPNAALHLAVKGGLPGANRFLTLVERLDVTDAGGRPIAGRMGTADGVRAYPVRARQPLLVTKWVYVSAAPDDSPGALQAAQGALDALRRKGIAALAASHRAAWEQLWQSDIRIDGDLEAQQAVRSCLFYLLCSARPGGRWSIPPMGLSGLQWGGHIFWDADMWMFPVLGLLHPDLALPIVDYRYRTLDGARWNAKQRGYRGADFATESAVTGRELAPAEYPYERHNTADVAIAQWRHFLLSGDRRRLAAEAYPILRETATYWASRVVYNRAKDRYEIRHVISPDETARFVGNDVYTNAAAKLNLQYAVEAGRLLGKPSPPEWKTIADKLWLPFDAAHRRYLEHEGYIQTRRQPKQADAQLLFFPLDMPAPPDVRANTLAYYAAHTSPVGPAMTASVHAVIAARLAAGASAGRPDRSGSRVSGSPVSGSPAAGAGMARSPERPSGSGNWLRQSMRYFQESYRPFVRPPFNDFSEKRTSDNTTFLTGCAGVVTGPLYGFGGVRYDERGIRARPVLPPGWTGLHITGIHYRGRVYDLDSTRGKPGGLTERSGR